MPIRISEDQIQLTENAPNPWLAPPEEFGGGGFFETLRIEGRRVRLFEEHWARLTRTLAHWSMEPPCGRARILEALAGEASAHPANTVLRARIVVVPAAGAPAVGELVPTEAWVGAKPVPEPHCGPLGSRPAVRLMIPEGLRVAAAHPLNGFKTTQRHVFWEARRRARLAGYDDALLLNERGEMVETATANILWIRGGALMTPAAGALPGVVARWLLDKAGREGMEAREVHASPEELDEADVVVVTNSVIELAEVAAVGEKKCGNEKKREALGRLIRMIEEERESIEPVELS